jgi:transcriptional regulator with XRE-family HTH domain
MNPLKELRIAYHLSQREAASICGITEQVILKTEQGLYPTMPPSVLYAFSAYVQVTPESLESEYEYWINAELLKVKLPVGLPTPRTPAEFLQWRGHVCLLNKVPDTLNSFCKLFKINPYVMQKFEAGKLKQTPLQLVERIAFIRGEF